MRPLSLAFGAALLAAPAIAVAADPPPGDLIVDARLRYEGVDQDGLAEGAQALTLRTRLGYETPAWRGFKLLGEIENVTAIDSRYNSTTNGKARYPVVGDPEVTELNRAQVSRSVAGVDVVAGRQRLILGNARFIGNAGFRQNEQTFDAAKLVVRPSKTLTVTYAYIDRVHRVFGGKSSQGEWDSDSHLVQADLKTRLGQLNAYSYLLDFPGAPNQSNATSGARLSGSHPLRPGLSLTYEAEIARQADYRSSPARFDLGYLNLAAGLKGPTNWVSGGVERLDGDGRRGFQTPLATLFAYQGWADVFLTTPATGVRDLNLNLGATLKWGPKNQAVRLQAAVHDFADDDGSRRYGREVDLLAATPLNSVLSAEVRAAIFEGDRPGLADRQKVWFTLEARY